MRWISTEGFQWCRVSWVSNMAILNNLRSRGGQDFWIKLLFYLPTTCLLKNSMPMISAVANIFLFKLLSWECAILHTFQYEKKILMRTSVDTVLTCSDYIATWPTKRVQYFILPFHSHDIKQWEMTDHQKHLKVEGIPSIIMKTVLLEHCGFQKEEENSNW